MLRTPPVRPPSVKDDPSPTLLNPTRLVYSGESSIVIRGAHSGRTYLFAPHGEALEVDGRDVDLLLALGQFEML